MMKAVTISATILILAMVGCARQPATTQVSSPAPGGAGGSGSASDSMRQASANPGGGRGGSSMGGGTASRPDVRDFQTVADLRDIHFDYDKADIRDADARVLDANADWLKAHADRLILIEGHCDERGTNEYNTALGDRRAKATMNYLVSRGVPSARITVISYGEERPACSQHADDCWTKNRRAHFQVKSR